MCSVFQCLLPPMNLHVQDSFLHSFRHLHPNGYNKPLKVRMFYDFKWLEWKHLIQQMWKPKHSINVILHYTGFRQFFCWPLPLLLICGLWPVVSAIWCPTSRWCPMTVNTEWNSACRSLLFTKCQSLINNTSLNLSHVVAPILTVKWNK